MRYPSLSAIQWKGEKMIRLLDKFWYQYLFAPLNGDIGWLKTIWCRLKNHPAGIIYYSDGFEPNNHCKNCGDEL